jgi:hypothetical protein
MYGYEMGTLDVLVNGTNVWSLSGNQGNQWNYGQVSLSAYAGGSVTIEFVGTYGGGYWGDMALDNISIGECAVILGCTDSLYTEYDALANTDDGTCITLVVNGCTDPTATNYDAAANTYDGSCIGGLSIGDTYQGGIVFYLDGNGGGLIAAPTDQSAGAEWGCWGTTVSGVNGSAIGTGAQNTHDIVNANCSPYTAGNSIAAHICDTLTIGIYDDWFLPSKDELNLMWLNLADSDGDGVNTGPSDQNNLGGFSSNVYWSSNELMNYEAIWQHFGDGIQGFFSKNATYDVRAVRAF